MMQILAVSVPLEEFLSILGKFHARGLERRHFLQTYVRQEFTHYPH